uniref:Retrovirus-related Pol polyprotein from transposon TNT 1-94 n=1 Tax=Cajanus cajan TaxID=3821 RepID=A0A151RDK8_CAJCA|nr:hypothetical protein KK1_038173 [Cajanus cajan]
MCLMIIKRSILEVFRGSISESHNAKGFLDAVKQYFTSNEKADASSLLAKLIFVRYKGKGNIRKYIMEMSNLASKLKVLKLELSNDLLVHLVLISLPTHFGQFKVSYNTQKDKWTLNELISHYVQEEERQQREKTESVYLASSSENTLTCFFCKKPGHMKKEKSVPSTPIKRSRGYKFYNPTTRSFFETRNERFLKDVEFGKEENIRNVIFEGEPVIDSDQVFVPITIPVLTLVIGDNHGFIPNIVPVQDNIEVLPQIPIDQAQQPREVSLRRSTRERRSSIPDDYIVFLQEHEDGIGLTEDDPINFC